MIIGITGGTGCGKTTALDAIRKLGGIVIDCDRVYHDLLKTDVLLLSAIENRFPGTVQAGALDRKALAAIVFSDDAALQDLNAVTHKAVKEKVLQLLEDRPPLAAIDAIELFDSGLADICDFTLAVTAPEQDRLHRLLRRDNITEEQAMHRIRAQKPESYFRKICNYTLENTGTKEEFMAKCLAFFREKAIMEENK